MSRELYVGNLSYEATEVDLRRLFSVAGTVSSIHLITDPRSGASKGCGYVKMSTAEEAKEAINSLDGALLINRLITVKIATPQKLREAVPKSTPGKTEQYRGPKKGRTFTKK